MFVVILLYTISAIALGVAIWAAVEKRREKL